MEEKLNIKSEENIKLILNNQSFLKKYQKDFNFNEILLYNQQKIEGLMKTLKMLASSYDDDLLLSFINMQIKDLKQVGHNIVVIPFGNHLTLNGNINGLDKIFTSFSFSKIFIRKYIKTLKQNNITVVGYCNYDDSSLVNINHFRLDALIIDNTQGVNIEYNGEYFKGLTFIKNENDFLLYHRYLNETEQSLTKKIQIYENYLKEDTISKDELNNLIINNTIASPEILEHIANQLNNFGESLIKELEEEHINESEFYEQLTIKSSIYYKKEDQFLETIRTKDIVLFGDIKDQERIILSRYFTRQAYVYNNNFIDTNDKLKDNLNNELKPFDVAIIKINHLTDEKIPNKYRLLINELNKNNIKVILIVSRDLKIITEDVLNKTSIILMFEEINNTSFRILLEILTKDELVSGRIINKMTLEKESLIVNSKIIKEPFYGPINDYLKFSKYVMTKEKLTFSVKNNSKERTFTYLDIYIQNKITQKKTLVDSLKVVFEPKEKRQMKINKNKELLDDLNIKDVSDLIEDYIIRIESQNRPVYFRRKKELKTNISGSKFRRSITYFIEKNKTKLILLFLALNLLIIFFAINSSSSDTKTIIIIILMIVDLSVLVLAGYISRKEHFIKEEKPLVIETEKEENFFEQRVFNLPNKEPQKVSEPDVNFIYDSDKITLKEYSTSLTNYIFDKGLKVEERTVIEMFSIISSTRFVIFNNDFKNALNFINTFSEYIGSKTYQFNHFNSENILNLKTIFQQAHSQRNLMHFIIIEDLDFNKEEDFKEILKYSKYPLLEVDIIRGSNTLSIPSNVWFFALPKDNSLRGITPLFLDGSFIFNFESTNVQQKEDITQNEYKLSYYYLQNIVRDYGEDYYIDEKIWKKIDQLNNHLNEYHDKQLDNRLMREIEKFTLIYLLLKDEQSEALDSILAYKILPYSNSPIKTNDEPFFNLISRLFDDFNLSKTNLNNSLLFNDLTFESKESEVDKDE